MKYATVVKRKFFGMELDLRFFRATGCTEDLKALFDCLDRLDQLAETVG